jgi:hypothetical protein
MNAFVWIIRRYYPPALSFNLETYLRFELDAESKKDVINLMKIPHPYGAKIMIEDMLSTAEYDASCNHLNSQSFLNNTEQNQKANYKQFAPPLPPAFFLPPLAPPEHCIPALLSRPMKIEGC